MTAAANASAPVTERQLHILEHSLGNPTHYRNYFATDENTDDYETICELIALGLMYRGRTWPSWMGGYTCFHVTEAGKAVAFAGAQR